MEHCINTRRPLPPVAWVVDSAPVRTVFCNLPPQKTKTIMQSTISLGSCPACRKLRVTTTNPNPSDNWWFDIAMSILSSENEDCHEDRGCSRSPARPPSPPSGAAQPGTNSRKPEGGRWRMSDNRIRAGTGAPFARGKGQHGNEYVTMTLTSGCNRTSVEHTAGHMRGRPHAGPGQPKRLQALPRTGGGGDKAKQEHPGRGGEQQGQTRRRP